ncbi:hypothetical protein CR161_03900 [Prosthecochloris sp. ZM]|uniref:hypothetical protein n=1 Tax=Prosthecochloris sp. ZM TaxID=2283143 RepID=UPI000DF73641|nr:hypothetical protein [Prosthecochloris sp. ZM]RDD29920.1 hypothetical protein CR161_03900 [Prosthecochloris sp. ZM]
MHDFIQNHSSTPWTVVTALTGGGSFVNMVWNVLPEVVSVVAGIVAIVAGGFSAWLSWEKIKKIRENEI